MAKKSVSKKKNLLKKEPQPVPNLTYEELIAIKTSGTPGVEKNTKKTVAPTSSDSHVQYVSARPKTKINDRYRD